MVNFALIRTIGNNISFETKVKDIVDTVISILKYTNKYMKYCIEDKDTKPLLDKIKNKLGKTKEYNIIDLKLLNVKEAELIILESKEEIELLLTSMDKNSQKMINKYGEDGALQKMNQLEKILEEQLNDDFKKFIDKYN